MLADKTIKRPGGKRLNAQTLQEELTQLAQMAGAEKAPLIQNYMSAKMSRALSLKCRPANQDGRTDNCCARLGGAPLLPPDFVWPKDRSGAPMLFIAQFYLDQLPSADVNQPEKGVLSIFRSTQILTMPVKDRRSFHLSFLPQGEEAGKLTETSLTPLASPEAEALAGARLPAWLAEASPSMSVCEVLADYPSTTGLSSDLSGRLQAWAKKFNILHVGSNRLFGADLSGMAEQKEICAFAASGISHSPARAKDSHYSHLLDDAPNWILWTQLDDAALFHAAAPGAGAAENDGKTIASTRLLIRREDLATGLFERGWLICAAS
jgi:hypothetical protein